jgi:hypothetical protein
LQPRHYSLNEYGASHVANIIVETLRQTVDCIQVDLSEIAQASRTTTLMVSEILTELTGLETLSKTILTTSVRFKLALEAVRVGALERAVRALTWQEFEKFSEECLASAGFETRKGIVFNDDKRRWQVDLVGVKSRILLSIDCKHWESRNYSSKFNTAVEHQKQSLQLLIRRMRALRALTSQEVSALPVIITLFEPRESLLDDVVLVSVAQLPDFLEHISPYDPSLPFISDQGIAESSISQDLQGNADGE